MPARMYPQQQPQQGGMMGGQLNLQQNRQQNAGMMAAQQMNQRALPPQAYGYHPPGQQQGMMMDGGPQNQMGQWGGPPGQGGQNRMGMMAARQQAMAPANPWAAFSAVQPNRGGMMMGRPAAGFQGREQAERFAMAPSQQSAQMSLMGRRY